VAAKAAVRPRTNAVRRELIRRLSTLGVEDQPLKGRSDGFSSLCYRGKAFAHFHSDCELDIRLTRRIIARERLVHPRGSLQHPTRGAHSPWIEVRFTKAGELDEVVRLVRLALEEL
jgi:hypothetical protein